jgi:hypothetical protein
MAAIKSDFASLPKDDDPTQGAIFKGILNELEARKWAAPNNGGKALKRAEMLAHLQGVAAGLIRADIDADGAKPKKERIYIDPSNEGIAAAFNEYGRAGVIFVGLPCAPNTITADDVAAAKKG